MVRNVASPCQNWRAFRLNAVNQRRAWALQNGFAPEFAEIIDQLAQTDERIEAQEIRILRLRQSGASTEAAESYLQALHTMRDVFERHLASLPGGQPMRHETLH